ncbi:RHS repeat-associated core domain-containing protein, partial [Xanthomonas graminis]|uniref:RHS repeat-associated core domain-containing protein n=2 Tax=Xanthomonas graminis TaxID=3390026 RepID=UPI000AD6725A
LLRIMAARCLGKPGRFMNYVQPDHLGTPRTVIDPVRDVAIWKWDIKGEAFGNTPPDQDADRDGTAFVFGMRFPGQRYDSATGLNQNYYRDYDASAGRYGQSDPLGLDGGIDTHAYVNGSSLGYIDPFGLARTSIDAAIQQALMRGDVGELETILEAAATNEERASARAAINRLNTRVGDIVSKECRGSINREFPGQYREKNLQELLQDKNAGDSAARKAGSSLTTVGLKNELFYLPHLYGWTIFT